MYESHVGSVPLVGLLRTKKEEAMSGQGCEARWGWVRLMRVPGLAWRRSTD